MNSIVNNNLPSSAQLENYYIVRELLQNAPEEVADEDKKVFCDLVLGLSPAVMPAGAIALVQKHYRDGWRQYCEWEWGTPEELRELKEEELLAQGWVRLPDGEMYFPFP